MTSGAAAAVLQTKAIAVVNVARVIATVRISFCHCGVEYEKGSKRKSGQRPTKDAFPNLDRSGMKRLAKRPRRRLKVDLAEQAWRVLEESRELIQERRRAHAARIEQLLIRENKVARELLGDHR